MAFDIREISAEIAAAGLMRTNKFEMNFTPPIGLLSGQNFSSLQGVDKLMHLYGEQANIPGVALDVAPIRRYGYGPMEKKPFAPIFNDAAFMFRSDAHGLVWKYMQSWMRLVLNYQNQQSLDAPTGILSNQHPFELAYKSDYITTTWVDVFDDEGKVKIRTVLRDAYPIFIGDVQLSWESKNEYMKIPVTFAFMDWYHADTQPIMAGSQLQPITPI
jgi:hypothetical protein